jgi:Zn-dependent protease with chaperone function
MIFLAALASFASAFVLSCVLNWLAMIPWRRSAGMHWTERARRLYPTRMSILVNSWLLGILASVLYCRVSNEGALASLPSAFGAWLGASLSGYLAKREVCPDLSFKEWAREFALYALLFQSVLLLLGITVAAMPHDFGWRTLLAAGAMVTLVLCLMFGLGLKIATWMRLVQPAPARVRDIAARASERAGAQLRNVWVTQGPTAQAFALVPMKSMLFSEPLLRALTDEELESVCAHEAGHLTESKWVFGGRMVAIVALAPLTLAIPVLYRFGLVGLFALVLAALAILMVPLGVARRMERRADAVATKHTEDPAAYARALEKVYQLNGIPATKPKRSGQPHPDLYDRMLAAGVTPSFERPRPARKFSWTTLVLIGAFGVQVAIFTTVQEFGIIGNHDPSASLARPFFQQLNFPMRSNTNAP